MNRSLSLAISTMAVLLLAVAPLYAADTVQDFTGDFEGGGGGAPPILVGGAGPISIIDGWDGKALRLTEEINSQNNGASFNQLIDGAYDSLVFEWQMTISPAKSIHAL